MELFPEIEPYRQGYLAVPGGHELYYEEVGNPLGRPVVYLHGGPGAGIAPKHRRFFHPGFWRIILFDQRGAGKSRPHASTQANTTWDLVEDMERLRVFLGISGWSLFGGSWGSTLALCYAIKHTHAVHALMLRGIFLGSSQEIHWLYQEGASRFFPEAYARFVQGIPETERHHLVEAYGRRLESHDLGVAMAAAKAWSAWEGGLCNLLPSPETMDTFESEAFALPLARLENHYCRHGFFLPNEGWILSHAHFLQGMPCRIVHGRYDMVCPPEGAYALHKALPDSEFVMVDSAGHSASDPDLTSALVRMAFDYQYQLGPFPFSGT